MLCRTRRLVQSRASTQPGGERQLQHSAGSSVIHGVPMSKRSGHFASMLQQLFLLPTHRSLPFVRGPAGSYPVRFGLRSREFRRVQKHLQLLIQPLHVGLTISRTPSPAATAVSYPACRLLHGTIGTSGGHLRLSEPCVCVTYQWPHTEGNGMYLPTPGVI